MKSANRSARKTKQSTVSRWVLFGVLGIPLPLVIYFYLILHEHFGVPFADLIIPAVIFCAFVPLFSAGACWGARARANGDSRLLFLVLGLFALLCGLEFSYFEVKLGAASHDSSGYAFTIVWAAIITVGGYFIDRWITTKHRENVSTK
ncbi:MAG: hypothetical protein ABSG52_06215 [Terriglobales bacterium]|jgi:hypothetical protein